MLKKENNIFLRCENGERSLKSLKKLFWGMAGLWVALAFFLPVANAETAPRRDPGLGVNILWWPGPEAWEERFKKAKAIGARDIRIDWEWRAVESSKGKYDWSKMDRLVQLASKYDMELLPILHYAPDWALPKGVSKSGNVYELAPDVSAHPDFAKFVRMSILRYGPGGSALKGADGADIKPVRFWQVWNEPNIKEFWGNEPDPLSFANLAYCVYKETRDLRGEKGAKLVHAGLAKADILFLKSVYGWKSEINQGRESELSCLDRDTPYARTFDIMAVNQYSYGASWWSIVLRDLDAIDESDGNYPQYLGSLKDPNYMKKIFNVQRVMSEHEDGKPIWITEVGFIQSEKPPGVSAEKQAELLRDTVKYIDENLVSNTGYDADGLLSANVQKIYWFALEDYPSPDGLGNFGLYAGNGALRQAGKVFQGINASESPP